MCSGCKLLGTLPAVCGDLLMLLSVLLIFSVISTRKLGLELPAVRSNPADERQESLPCSQWGFSKDIKNIDEDQLIYFFFYTFERGCVF